MRAAVLHGVRDVRMEDVDDPSVEEPTDAIMRVTHAAVCGSDLHPYRGRFAPPTAGRRPGHEFLGVVEDVGEDVARLRPGDVALAPFVCSDGTCPACLRGEYTSCERGRAFGSVDLPGGQAEAVRVPFADGTLWRVPDALRDEDLLPSVLLLGDVVGTGEHAARIGGVTAGDRVAVLGDGAVGLCATLAARRRDPAVLAVIGHHEDRLELARELGADVTIDGRDVHVADEFVAAAGGFADVVLESVGGGKEPLDLAVALVRDFGRIGSVGVFGDDAALPAGEVFSRNLRYAGGVAPTRAYLDELAQLVDGGELDPSAVLTDRLPIAETPEAYRRMDERQAVKVLLRP